MNSINIIGRISTEPETSTTANGKALVKFNVAVDAGKDARGERLTYFFPCHAWEKTAEIIAKFFKKGDRIGMSGRLEANVVEKDGKKTTYFSVGINNVDFIQERREEPKPEPKPEPREVTPLETLAASEPDVSPYELPEDLSEDEELPFEL